MADAQSRLEEWARKRAEKQAKKSSKIENLYDKIKRGDTSHGMRRSRPRSKGRVTTRERGATRERENSGDKKYWKSFWGKVDELRDKAAAKKKSPNRTPDPQPEEDYLRGRKEAKESSIKVERVNLDLHSNNGNWELGENAESNYEKLYGTKINKRAEKEDLSEAVNEKMKYYQDLARKALKKQQSFETKPPIRPISNPDHESRKHYFRNPDEGVKNGFVPRSSSRTRGEKPLTNLDKFFDGEMRRFEDDKKMGVQRRPRYKIPKHVEEAREACRRFERDVNNNFGRRDKLGSNPSPRFSGHHSRAQTHMPSKMLTPRRSNLHARAQSLTSEFSSVRNTESSHKGSYPPPQPPSGKQNNSPRKHRRPSPSPSRECASSSAYSTCGVSLPSKYATLSVKELVMRLRKLGVSIAGVKEKKDLVDKLVHAEALQDKKAAEERKKKERKELEERTIQGVRRWAVGKGIKELLNEIMKKPRGHPHHLTRLSTFDEVSRVYKRVLIKIHPDKNMHSFEALTRATEQFKIVNAMFNSFKARHEAS